ncbi:MAG: hypothetical protein IPK67_05510 [Planctomycetes bacterium]|nr:hypothetical protein [Planctomycetota bacterium]
MERELELLLEHKRREQPGADRVHDWERAYWIERVKAERLAFDSQSVRPYFAYANVARGVLEISAELYGVSFVRNDAEPRWHPAVECYDVFDSDGSRCARFWLDMHPRPDKYKHAALFPLRSGLASEVLPEACLVCNFSAPKAADPALMQHREVTTFFHEFGHLLHHLFAGRQRYSRLRGHRHRVGLRRGAEPALRGMGLGSVRAGAFRAPPRKRSAAARGAGAEAAGGGGIRQGHPGGPADVLRPARAGLPRGGPARPGHHRAPGGAQARDAALPLRGGHALPVLLRALARVFGDLLHVHVVVGDRQGPPRALRLRAHEPRAGARVPREGARPRRFQGRRPVDRRLPGPALFHRRLAELAQRLRGRSGSGPVRGAPASPAEVWVRRRP